MTTKVEAAAAASVADVDRRGDLFRRLLQAGIANPALLPHVEEDALLFLLPDDDPTFVEHEITAAIDSARRGHNVYLHHVRVADLPELPERTRAIGTEPGTRRATYDPDTGDIVSNQVLGEDGVWHATDDPFPIPRDDESDPLFRF
jgi:hypothetical protein